MEHSFWQQKWERNEIGFHLETPNPLLIKHFHHLKLQPLQCVLVPLCGKSKDISWLLEQGMHVVGVELSEIAVKALFESLCITPEVISSGAQCHYHASGIDIFQGDLFTLTGVQIGNIDAIYDRAALVALPTEMRAQYTQHLLQLTEGAPQLIITFDYPQHMLSGPPFSVPLSELQSHYQTDYEISLIESNPIPGGLKGQCEALEQVWLLSHR